jgi:hypothetical protein
MTMTPASEAVVFPVKIRRINSEERILSYALGPLIRGRRAPPILRLKLLPGDVWQIENLTGGMWKPLAAAGDVDSAYTMIHDLNQREMRQRGLRMW